jgi:misacylated tRNA(Ala) deacylase
LRTYDTIVSSVIVSEINTKAAPKPGKKAVLAPTLPKGPVLEVVLHDTILFPEGGGQPTDIGTINTFKDGIEKAWSVLQVKRHGGLAVHYVKVDRDRDVTDALAAFSPGSPVTAALGEEGWERRYDHMSMHTSQHLLSAILETRLNIPTLSWSLTASPSPCYVEIPRSMTAEEIFAIQAEANRLVFEGREVHVEVDELRREDVAVAPKLENGRSVGKALPDDYTGGVKRIIVIDGVDRNPCACPYYRRETGLT